MNENYSESGLVKRFWRNYSLVNKSVAGLNLTNTGNLVLLDKNNATIWCSFYHPIDSPVFWPPHSYLNANPYTSWTNTLSTPVSVQFSDWSTVRIILNCGFSGPVFACGFVCNEICNSYLFAIFVIYLWDNYSKPTWG